MARDWSLVPFMINSGQLDKAQGYIDMMPEDSPRRGEAELKTGQAMWGTYIRDSQILVSGCAGFLGYYFMQFFQFYAKELGIQSVIGLDNFFLGKPKWLEKIQLENDGIVQLHPFDIVHDDIRQIDNAQQADIIIHMASIASPTFYRKYPLQTIDANIWGLRNLLDFYKDKQLKGFLFFSSSEIYGDPPAEFIPTAEDYRGNVATMGPRACYDEAKRFGETICYLFAQEHGLPITIARPFNNYGPGMLLNDQRVPPDFAKAILEKRDIQIFSDGTPTRTFCYIADAVLGYLKVLTYGKFDYFNINSVCRCNLWNRVGGIP